MEKNKTTEVRRMKQKHKGIILESILTELWKARANLDAHRGQLPEAVQSHINARKQWESLKDFPDEVRKWIETDKSIIKSCKEELIELGVEKTLLDAGVSWIQVLDYLERAKKKKSK